MLQKTKKKQLPKYSYFCEACEFSFEVSHSLQKTLTICENCGWDDSLVRKPSEIFLTRKQAKMNENSKAGAVVEEAIEDAKQELKIEKVNLKNKRYNK